MPTLHTQVILFQGLATPQPPFKGGLFLVDCVAFVGGVACSQYVLKAPVLANMLIAVYSWAAASMTHNAPQKALKRDRTLINPFLEGLKNK